MGAAFRLYVEFAGPVGQGSIGSIQTGIAIANAALVSSLVTFELTTLSGTPTGLTGSLTVPAGGQAVMFLNQVPGFQSMPQQFQGVVRIASASVPIAVAGLRGRYNERGDFLITTMPIANEATPASSAERIIPHLAVGGGYTTQMILMSGVEGPSSTGQLRFSTPAGEPLTMTLR